MTSQFFANLAVVFSIGVLASTWYSTKLKNEESSSELSQKTNEIKELQKVHQSELKEKSNKIEKLQYDIISLQDIGIGKMEHQINTLTGGDSYPLVYLSIDNESNSYIYSGFLIVLGNYPLKNLSLQISIIQNGKTKKFPQANAEESTRQMTPIKIGNSAMVDLSEDPNSKIKILFMADNGAWIQTVHFRKNNDGKFEHKILLVVDQQPDLAPLVESDYGESVKIGTFNNWKSRQYKQNN